MRIPLRTPSLRYSLGYLLVAIALVAAMPRPASAQLTSGTITGTVSDETKAALPGVDVTVTNTATGLVRTAVTDGRGRFEAANLPVGTYDITTALTGFATAVRKGIVLVVGRTAVVDLVLPLASVQQEMVVTADAPLVETTTATVAAVIDEKKVQDLPLINRDLTQLTYLQQGVIRVPEGNSPSRVYGGMGEKFSVAGARGTQNLFLIDGVTNQDMSGNPQGVSGSYVGAESIQEIQIVTNNYSAEYRSAAGAIISAITKSGTNAVSGSMYEFLRTEALDALNYFDKKFGLEKGAYTRQQFGGSVGGPLRRNRLFFFGSYEGLRLQENQTSTALVPSVAARQGRLVSGRTVRVSPAVTPYLDLYPVPGQGNSVLEVVGDVVRIGAPGDSRVVDDFTVAKLDYQMSAANAISGTYTFERGATAPFGVLGDTTAVSTKSKKHVVSSKWASVLGSSSLNEFHFGYSDNSPQDNVPVTSIDFGANGLAFRPGRNVIGTINIPNLSVIGYRVGGEEYRTRSYTLNDGYSRTSGNHSIRAGGEWTYHRYNMTSCARGCNVDWEFANLEQFLVGVPRRVDFHLPGGDVANRDMRQHLLGAYFQDNWRARSDLTLNLGLRYEFASTIREVNGLVANLVNFSDAQPTTGVLYKNPTHLAFSPRIGFVWARAGGAMSLRGGVGVFYEHPMLHNVRTSLQELPPFTLVGRIEQRDANRTGREIDFPKAYTTQLALAQGRPNIRTFQYELNQPKVYRWSMTFQRQFRDNWVGSAGYTGSRGVNLWQQSLANLRRWEGWPADPPRGEKFFPAGAALINPNFGDMRIQYTNANSFYHGGSLAIQRRLDKGLQFGANVNYSKAIDEGSALTSTGEGLPQGQRGIYAYDLYMKRGLSAYDTRKVFTANVSYELPWGRDARGAAGALAGGWQLNAVLTVSDGYPLTVTEDNTPQFNRIGEDEDLRPNLIAGGNNNPVTGNIDRWYDVSQFTPSRLGYFGNLGRNTVTSPGLSTVAFSVFKNVGVRVGRVQVRMEIFNLLNRANFGTPNMTAFIEGQPNAQAGAIRDTRTPGREMQLGLRWIF